MIPGSWVQSQLHVLFFSLRFFRLFYVFMFACLHVHAPPKTVFYRSPHQGGPFVSVTGTHTP